MDKRKEFASVHGLRGVAALVVVLFHLHGFEAKVDHASAMLPAWIRFGYSGVDLFFVISGFVMVTIAAGRYRSPRTALTFLARRAWRVLPPYWLLTALVALWSAFWALRNPALNPAVDTQLLVTSFRLWPPGAALVLPAGWTLIHEGYFYLVMAAAICWLPERWLPGYLMGWAVAVGIANGHATQPLPWLYLTSSLLTWEFIAGGLIGRYWHRLPAQAGLPVLLVGMALFAGAVVGLNAAGWEGHGESHRVPLFGTASALIVLGAVRLESSRPVRLPAWLSAVGDSSYSLYLSHFFVISIATTLWSKTALLHTPTGHMFYLCATVLACLLVGWGLYCAMERPLQRYGRSILRSRQGSAQTMIKAT
ncbi:MAG: acyltransferase [Stenotrophomonas maltophilia]